MLGLGSKQIDGTDLDGITKKSFAHQIIVAVDLVATMALRIIDRPLGPLQRSAR